MKSIFSFLLLGLVLTSADAKQLETTELKSLKFRCVDNGRVVFKKDRDHLFVYGKPVFNFFDADLWENLGGLDPAEFVRKRSYFQFVAQGSWDGHDHIDYPNIVELTGRRTRRGWKLHLKLVSEYAEGATEHKNFLCDRFNWYLP